MANNYLQFAAVVPSLSEVEQVWVMEQLDPEVLDDLEEGGESALAWAFDPGGSMFEWKLGPEKDDCRDLWLYAEEFAEPEQVGRFMQAFLQKFRPSACFFMTWADWCDKPRPDEFSGGAVFVTAKEFRVHSAGDWVEQVHREFTQFAESDSSDSAGDEPAV